VDHEAIQQLLGAYALNAVEPDEQARVTAHVDQCSECRIELDEHLEVAALLPASHAFAPPNLWDTISQEIAGFQETDISQEIAGDPSAAGEGATVISLPRRWLRPLAVAAALVLLGAGAIVQSIRVGSLTDDLAAERAAVDELSTQLERPALDMAVTRALGDPSTRQVLLGSEVSGSNAIIVLMPDGTGYLAEHSLKPLPDEFTYQLWAIVDGRVISAGVLGSDPGVVPFHIDPQGFQGFAITEEVVGGVVSSQNDPVVAWLAA